MVDGGHLENEEFLVKVPQFFHIANEMHITVRLSTKRLVVHDSVEGNAEFDTVNRPHYDVSQKSQNIRVDDNSKEVYQLLVRISYGSKAQKTKCSTVVNSDNLDKFWQDYSNAVKNGMSGLIKKKKKKSKTKSAKTHKK